jgi:hypothetical protein
MNTISQAANVSQFPEHSHEGMPAKVLEHTREYLLTPIVVGILGLTVPSLIGMHHNIDEWLVKTVPLSASIAVIAFCVITGKFNSFPAAMCWSTAMLAGAAVITGAFNPMDVFARIYPNQAQSSGVSWVEIPFYFLAAYYRLYGAAAFCTGLASGAFIGLHLGWPHRSKTI